MSKHTNITGYRVVVYPRRAGDYGNIRVGSLRHTPEEERRICEGIAKQITKHVDKYDDDRGDVEVEALEEGVCEHCGSEWTEYSTTYNGGCCEEDEANNPFKAEDPTP